ncbi:hypothetical protein KII87_05790 [Leuconostoc gelidum subsp. gasicomitatum]|uniref:hypothetical protein n=1 Tax=Leuconostoc gasicomitatum TaxID=115778 RepID=UPI001CC64A87|nr:hypothetical protein [Leuconostoc gasicomitatum]MBZ5966219.1 hypothetical protein [Leuconostoc gasicomitatum]
MSSQNFNDLIEQINQSAGDVQRERGTLFEKLVLAYLKNEPTYKALYQNVWLLADALILKKWTIFIQSVK